MHAVPGRLRLRLDRRLLGGSELQAFIEAQPGVERVRLNHACRSVIIHYNAGAVSGGELAGRIQQEAAGLKLSACADGKHCPQEAAGPQKVSLLPVGLSTAATAAALAMPSTAAPWLLLAAAVPIYRRAWNSLFGRRRLNVDVLDASATSLLAVRGRFFTAAVMVWLVSIGDFLRDYTRRHSIEKIRGLYERQGNHAWLVRGRKRVRVCIDELRRGNKVVVYPGEIVPVDGVVTAGMGSVDQKVLTGESLTVNKEKGAEVFAGTVLTEGKLYVRTRRSGEDTKAAEIVRMILNNPVSDTRAQNYAERFADRVVPWSLLAAGGSVAATGAADTAASLLIVDFGTGIRVSAPTAVLASIARGARHGLLIKGGRYLELLAQVDTIVFDKTGTLTTGSAEVVDLIPYGGADVTHVVMLAAAAEARLNHPVAKAVTSAALSRGIEVPDRESSHYTIGMGVKASVRGHTVLVGNECMMRAHHVDTGPAGDDALRASRQGASALYVATDGMLAGLLIYSDPLRPEARAVIDALRRRGVKEFVLLTGDNEAVAADIARSAGIERWVANAFPHEKVKVVRQLQAEGRTVAVVGDGINDSPALVQADVGIAVQNGAEVARKAAMVSLMDESLWKIPQAMDLARESLRLIRQNWHLNLYPNSAAIAMTLLGVLGPIGATIISNGAALFATLNSLRPLLSERPSEEYGLDRPLERKLHDVGRDAA